MRSDLQLFPTPPTLATITKDATMDHPYSTVVTAVEPVVTPPDRLRQRLMTRVHASLTNHAGLSTVRTKDGDWHAVRPGVRVKTLWRGTQGNSVLIALAPGTALPPHRHRWIEEGIVLQGRVQLDDMELGVGDYHACDPGSRHGSFRSRDGALAYLRGTSLGQTVGVIRELLGALLPDPGPTPQTERAQDTGWRPFAPGVEQRLLRQDGALQSRFIRLAPGACLAGHAHQSDEENLLLQGEACFGDILVRADEFHLARAGSRHADIVSETGALLFVRGSVAARS
jgi:anti-sigma factor ChrR (cupin superfamily)